MKRVRSRLGGHVDHAAGIHPKLGGIVVGLNLELLNHVLVGYQLHCVPVRGVDWRTIDQHRALVPVAAPNLIITGSEHILPGQVARGAALRHNTRHQGHQGENIAAIQRDIRDRLTRDHLPQRSSFRLHHGRLRGDHDLLVNRPNLHGRVHPEYLVHLHHDLIVGVVLEPGALHVDLVDARLQQNELVIARRIRRSAMGFAGLGTR